MHIMKKLILTLLLILFRCIVIKSIRSENEYLWQPIKTIGMEFSSYEIQAYLDHKNMTKCWQLNMNSSCFQSIISKSIWLTILPNITISQPSMKDSQNNYDSRFDWHWSRLNWWRFFCTSLFQGVSLKIGQILINHPLKCLEIHSHVFYSKYMQITSTTSDTFTLKYQ